MQRFYAIIVGIIFLGAGIFLFIKSDNLAKNCTKEAEAIVVEMDEELSTDSDGNTSFLYYPVIEYKAGDKEVKQKMDSGSSNPAYNIGDKLTILYNPNKIDEFIVKGEKSSKIFSYALIAVGALITIYGVVVAIKPKEKNIEE